MHERFCAGFHVYYLMTNHVHLSPPSRAGLIGEGLNGPSAFCLIRPEHRDARSGILS